MDALTADPSGSVRVAALLDEIDHTLRRLSAAGCRGFECSESGRKTLAEWGRPLVVQRETLPQVQAALGDCRRCRLAEQRTHIVFGTGDARARLVFVGEGPGFEEDRQGEPFVGPAGQLLTKIIAAIHLTREAVYICNIVKCRPPGNRNPASEEIDACVPFLKRQLAAIQPEFVCALGTFAAQTLLGSTAPISRLRGRLHTLEGMQVLPTYHPAYLLRNPAKKRETWEDMQLLMQAMGIGGL